MSPTDGNVHPRGRPEFQSRVQREEAADSASSSSIDSLLSAANPARDSSQEKRPRPFPTFTLSATPNELSVVVAASSVIYGVQPPPPSSSWSRRSEPRRRELISRSIRLSGPGDDIIGWPSPEWAETGRGGRGLRPSLSWPVPRNLIDLGRGRCGEEGRLASC